MRADDARALGWRRRKDKEAGGRGGLYTRQEADQSGRGVLLPAGE